MKAPGSRGSGTGATYLADTYVELEPEPELTQTAYFRRSLKPPRHFARNRRRAVKTGRSTG